MLLIVDDETAPEVAEYWAEESPPNFLFDFCCLIVHGLRVTDD